MCFSSLNLGNLLFEPSLWQLCLSTVDTTGRGTARVSWCCFLAVCLREVSGLRSLSVVLLSSGDMSVRAWHPGCPVRAATLPG